MIDATWVRFEYESMLAASSRGGQNPRWVQAFLDKTSTYIWGSSILSRETGDTFWVYAVFERKADNLTSEVRLWRHIFAFGRCKNRSSLSSLFTIQKAGAGGRRAGSGWKKETSLVPIYRKPGRGEEFSGRFSRVFGQDWWQTESRWAWLSPSHIAEGQDQIKVGFICSARVG